MVGVTWWVGTEAGAVVRVPDGVFPTVVGFAFARAVCPVAPGTTTLADGPGFRKFPVCCGSWPPELISSATTTATAPHTTTPMTAAARRERRGRDGPIRSG